MCKNDGEVITRVRVLREGKDPVVGEIKDYDKNESFLAARDFKTSVRFRSWTFHHDIQVGAGSAMRRPTTTQFVTKLESGGGNLVPVLHTLYTSNRDFKNAIDDGMRAGFGGEYERLEFQPAAAQQIQLAVQWKSSTEPHAGQDLSDGTLRFLFLLTALAHPDPPPLVAIEEPEIGLHPSMLSIVAEFAASAAERTQVVITSHSPEFLDAFSEASPVVTLCNWEDGQTHIYTLDAERLKKWLAQYRLGHLFTSGELEALALPDVESVEKATDPFADLPTEDAALAESLGKSGDSMDG
jgi:predicted ATPase